LGCPAYEKEDPEGLNKKPSENGLRYNEKNYSCMGCGSSFSAKAPDDVHKFSSVYQCWNFDWIE
jgi:hypothetical protein